MARLTSTVAALMSPEPVTLAPLDSVADALARFERYPFRHLPVEQENRLVGIVSDRDLAFALGLPRAPRGAHHAPRRPRRVEELMQTHVHTAAPESSARAALERMLAQRIGALPVVHADGRLVGIVTATDFLRCCEHEHGWAPGRAPGEVCVGERMSQPIVAARPEEDLLEAAGRMLDARVRHLPVLDHGVLVGMLSDHDLRRGLARLVRVDRAGEARGAVEVPRLCVEDAMSRPCMTVEASSRLRAAAHAMLEFRIGALPVVATEAGVERLVGMLSQTDLLHHCCEAGALTT